MRKHRRAKWTIQRSDRHPDYWEVYHPSYGSYWLPDTNMGAYNALIGSKMMPASRSVIDKHFGEWSHVLSAARACVLRKPQ